MERIKRREMPEILDGPSSGILSDKIARQMADENPEAFALSKDFDRIIAEINDKYEELDEVEVKLRLFKIPEAQMRISEKRQLERLRAYQAKKFAIEGQLLKLLRDKASAGEGLDPKEVQEFIKIMIPRD